MLRNSAFYLLFVPVTLFFSTVGSLALCCSEKIRDTVGWFCCFTWARLTVALSGLPVDVDVSALDPDQNYIFMVNHSSQLDIPVLTAVLGRTWRIIFIGKESLFTIPLFGWTLTAAGHIPINRKNRRCAMESIAKAAEVAAQGRSILVFPDGTRATDLDKLQPFNTGGMIVALKTTLPVAPVVVTGTGQALPKKALLLRRARIVVRALPPVQTQGVYTIKDRTRLKDDLYTLMDTAYREQLRG